jgi:hypothetical protein
VKECGADCSAVPTFQKTCACIAADQSQANGEVLKLAATVNHPQMPACYDQILGQFTFPRAR